MAVAAKQQRSAEQSERLAPQKHVAEWRIHIQLIAEPTSHKQHETHLCNKNEYGQYIPQACARGKTRGRDVQEKNKVVAAETQTRSGGIKIVWARHFVRDKPTNRNSPIKKMHQAKRAYTQTDGCRDRSERSEKQKSDAGKQQWYEHRMTPPRQNCAIEKTEKRHTAITSARRASKSMRRAEHGHPVTRHFCRTDLLQCVWTKAARLCRFSKKSFLLYEIKFY